MRTDNLIDVPQFRSHVGIGEALAELLHFFSPQLFGILSFLKLPLIDDVHGAFRSHNRDLGRGVRIVNVGADVFRRHYAVSASVRLACNHGDFGHRRLGEGEQQLGAVTDNAAELLLRARQESGHVLR